MKKTKQGVRDLNSIPSKPRGVTLDPVPEAADADSPKFYLEGSGRYHAKRNDPRDEGGLG